MSRVFLRHTLFLRLIRTDFYNVFIPVYLKIIIEFTIISERERMSTVVVNMNNQFSNRISSS